MTRKELAANSFLFGYLNITNIIVATHYVLHQVCIAHCYIYICIFAYILKFKIILETILSSYNIDVNKFSMYALII